jgi:hypothetical protein
MQREENMDRPRGNGIFNKVKGPLNKHLGSFTSDRTAKAEGDVGGMHTAAPPGQRPIRSRMKREIYKGKVVQACAWTPPAVIGSHLFPFS